MPSRLVFPPVFNGRRRVLTKFEPGVTGEVPAGAEAKSQLQENKIASTTIQVNKKIIGDVEFDRLMREARDKVDIARLAVDAAKKEKAALTEKLKECENLKKIHVGS